jgi:3-hydroxyacyl-CoA dehydrogenase
MSERKATVRYELAEGVAILTIDNPPVNATSHALRSALKAQLDVALGDEAAEAVVLIGAGRGFIAGADISEFGRPRQEPLNPTIVAAMEAAKKPIIAAIHGHALGGGLELAMGCHCRLSTPDAKLGQPEVKIGLTPGAGGTQRLPRLVGLPLALEMIVGGDPISAPVALEHGLIDEIITGDLRAGAIAFAKRIVAERQKLRRVRDLPAPALPEKDFFAHARAVAAERQSALEAPQKCIAALEAALLPFDQGLQREAVLFAEAVASEQSQALRHLFFAERETSKVAGLPTEVRPREIKTVAVIGVGTMGGAIAACCLDAGLKLILIETEATALERGLTALHHHCETSARRRGTVASEIERRFAGVTTAIDLTAVAEADLIIEAVFEDLPLKQKVFAALGKFAKPDTVLATNTSYCDVESIAAGASTKNVLGLHFFSPATIMRAVEIVRTTRTSPAALATAIAFARKIRKLPVVVGTGDGFVGNRLLMRRGREAERMALAGAPIATIDHAMLKFGFPIGPFAATDLAGLDIGDRARRARGIVWPLADAFVRAGRLGQKTGAGYYRYEPGSRAALPDPEAQRLVDTVRQKHGRNGPNLSPDEIVARLLYPMINEGARALAEGVAARASDIDVIWVYGFGWPAYRGGPMFYADRIGLSVIRDRLVQLAAELDDPTLRPTELLERLAQEGKGFADLGAPG